MRRRWINSLLAGVTLTVLSASNSGVGAVQAQVPTASYGEGPGASGVAGTTIQIQTPQQAGLGTPASAAAPSEAKGVLSATDVAAFARALPATGTSPEPSTSGWLWFALGGVALLTLGIGVRQLQPKVWGTARPAYSRREIDSR